MMPQLQLFVYGSLKRGHAPHEQFCRGFVSVCEATVLGRLYEYPPGYPMLIVPEAHILAHGTSDPESDLATAATLTRQDVPPVEAPGDDWEAIAGELYTFDDAPVRLPRLDEFEEFQPDGECLYHRVMVPLRQAQGRPIGGEPVEWAWIYVAPNGRLPKGSRRIGCHWPWKD